MADRRFRRLHPRFLEPVYDLLEKALIGASNNKPDMDWTRNVRAVARERDLHPTQVARIRILLKGFGVLEETAPHQYEYSSDFDVEELREMLGDHFRHELRTLLERISMMKDSEGIIADVLKEFEGEGDANK